jgi:ribosome-binding factor A
VTRHRSAHGSHRYPRSARVNELLREVLADTLERLAQHDERLSLLTVTAVESEPDLRHARVLFASLSDPARLALERARGRLQSAVGAQAHFKRTPQLSFDIDPAVASGQRVEEILRELRAAEAEGTVGPSSAGRAEDG